jgi:hypothetical protein
VAGWAAFSACLVTAWLERDGGRVLGFLDPMMTGLIAVGRRVIGWSDATGASVGMSLLVVAAGAMLMGAAEAVPLRPRRALRVALVAAVAGGCVAVVAGWHLWTAVAVAVTLGLIMIAGLDDGDTHDEGACLATLLPWILVVAAVLRLWAIDRLPPGFGTHGSSHLAIGLDALTGFEDVLRGGMVPFAIWLREAGWILVHDQHGPLAAVQMLGFVTLGVGYVQARMMSAILGIVSVWLAAVVGGWIGDRRLGSVAAMMLAVAPWHVTFSRGNDAEHVLVPLHAMLVLGLVVRAHRRGRWPDFVAAGVLLGASYYIYATNQFVPLIAVALLATVVVTAPRVVARDRRRWAMMVALAIAVASPFLATWWQSLIPVPVRTSISVTSGNDYSLASVADVLPNIRQIVVELVAAADDQWITNPDGLLGPWCALLLVPGLVMAVGWIVRPVTRLRGTLLIAWFVAGLIPALASEWVLARRLVLAAAAAEWIAAAGAVLLWQVWRRNGGRAGPGLAIVGLAIVTHVGLAPVFALGRVTVPESRLTAMHTEFARLVRVTVPFARVVVVTDSEPVRVLTDAIKIGAAPVVRRLLARGTSRACLWQVVSLDEAKEVLVQDHLTRLVVPWQTTDAIRELYPVLGPPVVIRNDRGDPLLSWWDLRGGVHPDRGALPPTVSDFRE